MQTIQFRFDGDFGMVFFEFVQKILHSGIVTQILIAEPFGFVGHDHQQIAVGLRFQRQEMIAVADQHRAFFGDFPRGQFVCFTGFLRGGEPPVPEQAAREFHFQHALCRFIDAPFRNISGIHGFFGHVEDIGLRPEHHIGAGVDHGDHPFFVALEGNESAHDEGIGDQHALETELLPEQTGAEPVGKRGRETAVVHARQPDMSGHDRFHSRIDDAPVDFAVSRIPFGPGHPVEGHADMLIAEIETVAGEMFCGGAESLVLHAADDLHGEKSDQFRIGPECAGGDGRSEPVHHDIGHRTESPMEAAPAGALSEHLAEFVSQLGIAGRPDGGQVRQFPAGPVFQVAADQQRDFCFGFQGFDRFEPFDPLSDQVDHIAAGKIAAERVPFHDFRVGHFAAEEFQVPGIELDHLTDFFPEGQRFEILRSGVPDSL